MQRNHKKGQAAIEYLMTYGWAILVIVAVLAILIGSGLFSSKSFSTSSAVSPPQLGINQFYLSGDSQGKQPQLLMNVSNNFGYKIKLNKVNATFRETTVPCAIISTEEQEMDQGSSVLLKCDFKDKSPRPSSGTTAKVDLRFEYINCYYAINDGCTA
ncbi:MAG: hypothetical protein NTY68_04305, partial [Candidatus Micrarchaeota archaeon]|nr:hypothetical protein [Candidatus Micrarchaeota archaeon]